MLDLVSDERRRYLMRIALHYWQGGESEILAPHRRATRAAYERAIAAVMADMRDLRTMEQLLTHYLFQRRRLAFLTERACRAVAPTTALSRIWVRDAAFWRHLRMQVQSPPAGGVGDHLRHA